MWYIKNITIIKLRKERNMAFRILKEEFLNDEKFVTVIPGAYGICVCLKTRKDNKVELIKYEKLEKNKVSKTLADYLATDDLNLAEVYVSKKCFKVPKSRDYTEIKTKFKEFLESLES